MRDAIGVHVERAIVHVVDHHQQQQAILSDVELSLDAPPKLQAYFDAQIANALADPAATAAKFRPEGETATADLCYGILSDEEQLLPNSQRLAERLFATMSADRRIVAGSLVVCLYSATNYRGKKFLGLIKIDPSEVFVQKISTDRQRRRVISFEVRDDALPTAREKLQKAAIVQPRRRGLEYELLLLDRQVAKVAANFFASGFLNATPALDAQARTDKFYTAAQIAYNRLVQPAIAGQPRLTSEQAEVLRQGTDAALQWQTLNVDAWVDNLDLPADAKEVLHEEIGSSLPADREFSLDTNYAREKLVKKMRFRGDYGVLFEIESAHYGDVVKGDDDLEQPDGSIVKRLVLEIPGLKWVKR